jgi:hypothetical protein
LGRVEGAHREALDQFLLKKKVQVVPTQPKIEELYKPLGDGEIRILELHPGAFGSELSGELQIASIDFEYPSVGNWTRFTNHAVSLAKQGPFWYTALSYVWGVPKFDVVFRLGEKHSIRITKTLSCALQQLRDAEQSVFLWIDQICINQASVSEKERQIPLMGMIYRYATNCLIWLGDEGKNNANLALETLQTVHARLQQSDQEITDADFERLALPGSKDIAWWEVKQLFRRPWFKRLWTIQEVILPTDVYVKCGKATVPWDNLSSWCATMKSCGLLRWLLANSEIDNIHGGEQEGGLVPASGGETITALETERRLVFQNNQSLLNILVETRYAQAWEPKDKIYGVLGLVDVDITPTYAKSTKQVYFEACVKVPDGDLYRLLNCVDHETPERPSWIPDWSKPRVTESLGFTNTSWAIYAAGGRKSDPARGLKYPFVVPITVDHKAQAMIMNGKIFDAISILGDVATIAALDIDDPVENNMELASYVETAKTFEKYPSGGPIFDAFWQTLVAGKDPSGRMKAPTDYSEVFSLVLDSSTGKMPSLPGQTYSPRRKKGFFTLQNLRSRKPAQTLADLRQSYRAALRNRRFSVSEKGYFALVPRGTQAGDKICVLEGINVPYILRAVEGEGGYELVGECFVYGIMEGEVMDMEHFKLEPIKII